MKLKKKCKCGKIIDQSVSMCDECKKKKIESKKKSNRVYNSQNRDKEKDKFYKSKEWKAKRKEILDKYKGLDIYDYIVNEKITYANVVHHIEELGEAKCLALDNNNLIPLTDKNHKRIHKFYNENKEKKLIMQIELKKILEKANQNNVFSD